VASVALLTLPGCGGDAPEPPVDFATEAVPSVPTSQAVGSTSSLTPADEAEAVIAAYAAYVMESDRYFDESIAQAAATGAFAGSPELDAILDAVAVGRIRDFDVSTPMSLWESGGVATVGTPVIVSSNLVIVDSAAETAELKSCLDLRSVDYLNSQGTRLKRNDVPDYLLETVSLVHQANPRNDDLDRWYVENRVSEQVAACE